MSFFRRMATEKGIIENMFEVNVEGTLHLMEVAYIIDLIELAHESEQRQIKDTFSKIDFKNGDLMDYIKFLAKAFVQTQYAG